MFRFLGLLIAVCLIGCVLASPAAAQWTTTPTKTAAYSAACWEQVMCDPSNGSFAVTLPSTVPAGAQQIGVHIVGGTTNGQANKVTVIGNPLPGGVGIKGAAYGVNNVVYSLTLDRAGEAVYFWFDHTNRTWEIGYWQ